MNKLLICLFTLFLINGCQKELTSEEILDKSISFHDPKNQWGKLSQHLFFDEHRSDGSIRKTSILLDLPNSTYEVYRPNQYSYKMTQDQIQIDSGEVTLERAKTIKNYYLYLWGLPMKLKDPGTKLGPWKKSSWQQQESLEIAVPYDKDTWYFHFDPNSFEMIGYQFFTDAAQSKGETILLEGLHAVADMKIPKSRSWYTLPEDEFLGRDVLINAKK